jgi:site-specific DNA-methyltransferase (adenine-specific)
MKNEIINGDCLDVYEDIEPSSADLIFTDPPYGNIKDLDWDKWESLESEWDEAIAPEDMFKLANHLLRQRGKFISFSMEPYTSKLVSAADSTLPFSYKLIWEKDHFGNTLMSGNAPVNYYEELAVFTKQYDWQDPVRQYFKHLHEYIGESKAEIIRQVGQRADHTFRYDSTQFSLCTRETYNALINTFAIDEWADYREYDDLPEYNNVFNLPEGENHKPNILKYDKAYGDHHPTQKPVPLLVDLIKTYTNPGDLVVDPFAGSGSTAVAAKNTGREFIGIEQREDYAQTARKRTNAIQQTLTEVSD